MTSDNTAERQIPFIKRMNSKRYLNYEILFFLIDLCIAVGRIEVGRRVKPPSNTQYPALSSNKF